MKALFEVQAELKSGSLVLKDWVQSFLDRIENRKNLNAFLEVYDSEALAQAVEVQEKINQGTAGKLAGLVIGLKDNICYKGHQVGAASKILSNYESLFSATVVERLIKEDAIIIGRLNMDEFAMGSSNENSFYGNVLNPIQEDKVPGGSSGGSASAVAADLCMVALGSDTGGSIRQPAAFCGIQGFKPSYGTVSRWGLIAYASSFDQIGPFTKNISDAISVMDVIAGKDDYDSTMTQATLPAYKKEALSLKGLKIAVIKECIESEGVDPEVKKAFEDKIAYLKSQGAVIEDVSFPYLDYMIPTYYVLTTAEASANLARFDGIRYGYRSPNADSIENTFLKSRSEGFGPEVQRRIMLGSFVLSSGYYDAYYTKAQKVRRVIKNETNALIEKYDFILSPTTPATAFEIGAKSDDPIQMYLQDIFTVQSNLAGNPSISIPMGTHSNGLPMGLHILGENFGDAKLLNFASQLEN